MSKKKESDKTESQDKTSQDSESQKTEKTEATMAKTVTVKKDEDAPENIFNLDESLKQGQKYHLAKGGDGLHFKTLESVKTYFERRYKGHQVKID